MLGGEQGILQARPKKKDCNMNTCICNRPMKAWGKEQGPCLICGKETRGLHGPDEGLVGSIYIPKDGVLSHRGTEQDQSTNNGEDA